MSIVPVASGTYDGVSPSPEPMTLWESLRQADIDDGAASVKTVWESAGLGELRRRNGLLGQENEVLRRAAAYPFAVERAESVAGRCEGDARWR